MKLKIGRMVEALVERADKVYWIKKTLKEINILESGLLACFRTQYF